VRVLASEQLGRGLQRHARDELQELARVGRGHLWQALGDELHRAGRGHEAPVEQRLIGG